jgi:hypothetical protein
VYCVSVIILLCTIDIVNIDDKLLNGNCLYAMIIEDFILWLKVIKF